MTSYKGPGPKKQFFFPIRLTQQTFTQIRNSFMQKCFSVNCWAIYLEKSVLHQLVVQKSDPYRVALWDWLSIWSGSKGIELRLWFHICINQGISWRGSGEVRFRPANGQRFNESLSVSSDGYSPEFCPLKRLNVYWAHNVACEIEIRMKYRQYYTHYYCINTSATRY